MFVRFGLTALGLLVLSACSDSDTQTESSDPDILAKSMQVWEDAQILSYQYTLKVVCYCGTTETAGGAGDYVVTVTDGLIESAFVKDTGEYLDAERLAALPTIDDLFAEIEDAYASGADEVVAEYDPTYGYPVQVLINPIMGAADDEQEYSVADLM